MLILYLGDSQVLWEAVREGHSSLNGLHETELRKYEVQAPRRLNISHTARWL